MTSLGRFGDPGLTSLAMSTTSGRFINLASYSLCEMSWWSRQVFLCTLRAREFWKARPQFVQVDIEIIRDGENERLTQDLRKQKQSKLGDYATKF